VSDLHATRTLILMRSDINNAFYPAVPVLRFSTYNGFAGAMQMQCRLINLHDW